MLYVEHRHRARPAGKRRQKQSRQCSTEAATDAATRQASRARLQGARPAGKQRSTSAGRERSARADEAGEAAPLTRKQADEVKQGHKAAGQALKNRRHPAKFLKGTSWRKFLLRGEEGPIFFSIKSKKN